MKYIVIEIQKAADGTIAHLLYDFNTRAEAESKYHYILSFAAVSTLPLYSVVLLNDYGETLYSKFYENIPDPEPEPEPEPEPNA